MNIMDTIYETPENSPQQTTTTSILLPRNNSSSSSGDHTPNSYGTVPTIEDSDSSDDDDDELQQEILLRESLLKQAQFELSVDPHKGYRANELKFSSFQRPHMRSFHSAWICFLLSWFLWFSITPLLPIIQSTLKPKLSDDQIATTNLYSMVGGLISRLALGPLCDQYGPRIMLTGLLGLCAIPILFGGLLIQSFSSLMLVRIWVGTVGGTLVPAQYWITTQFSRQVCGRAMAIVAGWGAMGGGLAQLVMGTVIFPILLNSLNGQDDLAWRIALVVPGFVSLAIAIWVYFNSEDCPLGNLGVLQKAGLVQERSAVDSFRSGAVNFNAWILFIQFAASLGIELTMESNATIHLSQRFDFLTLQQAAGYASLFGLMNMISRGLGGYASDLAHSYDSLRGRLLLHMSLMITESICIWIFMTRDSFTTTIISMVIFGFLGQMSMGSCFGIVPYVDPPNTGTIAGIVGAGGNVGAIIFLHVWKIRLDYAAFQFMACFCFIAASLTFVVNIKGYKGIIWGKSNPTRSVSKNTLIVPAPTTSPPGNESNSLLV